MTVVAVAADKRAADSTNAVCDECGDAVVVVPVAVTQRAADARRQQQRQPLWPVTTNALQPQPNANADSIMQQLMYYNVARQQRCVVAVLRRRRQQLQLQQRPVCGVGGGGADVY